MLSRAVCCTLITLLLFSLVGCATTDDALIRERTADGRKRDHVPIVNLPTMDKDLTYLRDAAAMSANVYDPEHPALPLGPEWVPDTDIPSSIVPGTRQTPDLTYRVWVNEKQSPPVAVLVFRGTHIRADWYSNLRWVTSWIGPKIEDHYEQTQRITPNIVRAIRSRYGAGTRILAAGHSLGGGLAQTAAYASCGEIETVFAFDSSPVTKHRARNACTKFPVIFYRVFERSEVLSWARFIVRRVLGLQRTDPHMVEIKVHLFQGVGIRAHSMPQLAVKLDEALHPAPPQQAVGNAGR